MKFLWIPIEFLCIPIELPWIIDSYGFLWNALILDCMNKHLLFPASAIQDKAASTRNVNCPVHVPGSGLLPDWWERRHMEEPDQEAGRKI